MTHLAIAVIFSCLHVVVFLLLRKAVKEPKWHGVAFPLMTLILYTVAQGIGFGLGYLLGAVAQLALGPVALAGHSLPMVVGTCFQLVIGLRLFGAVVQLINGQVMREESDALMEDLLKRHESIMADARKGSKEEM